MRRHRQARRDRQGEGAPAAGRRAPLRPDRGRHDHRGDLVLPPLVGGLHCGAVYNGTQVGSDNQVLPPLVGGLHCGAVGRPRRGETRGRAPAAGRRAPLRQHRQRHPVPAGAGCSRRWSAGSIAAPLSVSVAATWLLVLPPLVGGLHCGKDNNIARHILETGAPAAGRRAPLRHVVLVRARRRARQCSRRWSAGSIAAHARASVKRSAFICAPAAGRRAPLRPLFSAVFSDCPAKCSRRWSAGSIAAARPRSPGARWRTCSRRWSAGSIAARTPGPSRDAPATTCSRRWSAGSIAAGHLRGKG